MAAFKAHCGIHFWKASLIGTPNLDHFTSIDELPPKKDREALKEDPTFDPAFTVMVGTLVRTFRYRDVIEACNDFLERHPKHKRTAALRKQIIGDAIQRLQKGMREEGSSAVGFSALGDLYIDSRNYRKAERAYREALARSLKSSAEA